MSRSTVIRIAALVVGLLAAASPVTAAFDATPPALSVYEGTVGRRAVVALLDPAVTTRISGVYFYRHDGRDIALSGMRTSFDEHDPSSLANPDGATTARFTGRWSTDSAAFTGTWRRVGEAGAAIKVSLHRVRFTGTNATARIRSTVRSAQSPLGTARYRVPVVTGTTPTWIGTRIAGDFAKAALLDDTLDAVIAQYTDNGGGITDLDYDVVYNGEGVLDLRVRAETMGAYPDQFAEDRLYDVRTGAHLRAGDLFASTTKPALVKLLQSRVDAIVDRASKAEPSTTDELRSLVATSGATIDDRELGSLSIGAAGVVFHHDFGFPHVAQALEPNGDVPLRWRELAPFVRTGGLLDPLARRG